jgi:hypothetical protein
MPWVSAKSIPQQSRDRMPATYRLLFRKAPIPMPINLMVPAVRCNTNSILFSPHPLELKLRNYLKRFQEPAFGLVYRIYLAKLKQLNHKDHEDRKEKSLRGLCGLRGSNSSSTVLTCARFTNG